MGNVTAKLRIVPSPLNVHLYVKIMPTESFTNDTQIPAQTIQWWNIAKLFLWEIIHLQAFQNVSLAIIDFLVFITEILGK